MRDTVAIIGAGPGLGTALARRFGEEGHPVALVARDADLLADLARDRLGRFGNRARLVDRAPAAGRPRRPAAGSVVRRFLAANLVAVAVLDAGQAPAHRGGAESDLVEEALADADDLGPLTRLVDVLDDPFTERDGLDRYAAPAPPDFGAYRTFCGT